MSQNPPNQPYVEFEDEIDLVDYIKVVLKRKWIIIVGTILIALGSVGYQWMQGQAPQKYEAKASLLIIPPPVKSDLLPKFSTGVYQTLAEAQDLKLSIIDSLNAIQSGLPRFSPRALDGVLSTSLVSQGENSPFLMDFVVTTSDTVKKHPVQIANIWATQFVKKNQGINSSEAGGSYEFISDQYDIAKQNLESTEDAMAKFNRGNDLETLRIEWTTKHSKLIEYQTEYFNSDLQLRKLENSLAEIENSLSAQETSDGVWLGAEELLDTPVPEANLRDDQLRVRQAVVHVRDRYFSLSKKIRQYQLENGLLLEESVLSNKRAKLIAYLSDLSQLRIDAGAVGQALQDNGDEKRLGVELPALSSATENGLRELVSLKMGYNLLDMRYQLLQREIFRLHNEVDSLSLAHSRKTKVLDSLNTQFNLESQNYQIFESQYSTLKKRVNSLKLSISELQPEVSFLREEIPKLLKDTGMLKSRLTVLETQQSRLTRELEIYRTTFDKFAELLEDARIANAAQPEDIKIVARAVSLTLLPHEPRGLSVLLAAAAGLVVSTVATFLMEFFDRAKERLSTDD